MTENPFRTPVRGSEGELLRGKDTSNEFSKFDLLAFVITPMLVTVGLVVPVMLGVAERYFQVVGMDLPVITQALFQVPPISLTLVAIAMSTFLFYFFESMDRRALRWSCLVFVSMFVGILVVSAFAVLSPMLGFLSGL